MTNTETKLSVIRTLSSRGVYFKKVNDREYVTRCPFCGDSSKSYNTGHLYIKIDLTDNSAIPFHCFKCEASGVLNEENLSDFGIDDLNLKSMISAMNKTSDKGNQKNIYENQSVQYFDFKIPPIIRNEKSEYLEKRLGISLSNKDLIDMKYIPSFNQFLEYNHLKPYCTPYIQSIVDKYYVGFLSFGNSHILFRDITNTQKIRWLKYPITKKSKECRIFYSTALSIDRMSTEDININLTEGILDILSAKHNLGRDTMTDINIAASGKSFDRVLMFMVENGFFGKNVVVNIYSDNDHDFNKKPNTIPTTVEWFRKKIGHFKPLFKTIYIYYNIIGKDIGVPKDQIVLKKFKL